MKQTIFLTICGLPNVGKSTLLNQILNEKISITSPKPNTTRTNIRGILTEGNLQIVFTDTPGVSLRHKKTTIEKQIYTNAMSSLDEAEVGLILVNVTNKMHEIEKIVNKFKQNNLPYAIAINKIDKLKENDKIVFADELYKKFEPNELFFISAISGKNCEKIIEFAKKHATETEEWFFDEKDKTDIEPEFWIKEIIREKTFFVLSKELPYAIGVNVDEVAIEGNEVGIFATIYSTKDSHKPIIIGKQGNNIQKIVELCTEDIKVNLGLTAKLQLTVKIDEKWFLKIDI